MKNVRWVHGVPISPVFNFATESTLRRRFQPLTVIDRGCFKSFLRPLADGNTNGVLIHFESLLLRKVQTSFPRIPKSIGPLSRSTVLLVPDVFLNPAPSLLLQSKNKFEDIGVAFAIHRFLFDVEN